MFRPEAHWLELANAINEPLQDMLRTKHGYAGLDIWAPRTGPYYLLEALALLRGRARHEPPMQNVEGKPPAVLVEVGFLTHPDEAYLLTQPSHHLDLARAIAKGLDTCMDVASRKAVIRGRVVSGERQPLAGVDIRATSDDRYPDNESREVQVFSRADGRFDLTLGVCRWSIVFKDPKGTYEANRLALDPDRTEMDLGDVVLRKPGTGTTVLFGQVFHGTTLGPMQDVLIAARQGEQTLSAVTNERGLFMLRFPGFGKWTVVWSAPGGSHEDVRQEVPADGETLILDLLMRPAGWYAIRGKVIAIQPGFPTLRGLRVVAELAELDVEARTDPQGEFTLKPPYNGSWTLTISDPQGIYESETAEALVTTDRPVEPVPTIHLRRRKP